MAVSGTRVTVATTATLLLTAQGKAGSQQEVNVRVQNPTGGQVVFLGNSAVTASAYGYSLAVAGEVLITLKNGESLYGIVAGTTQVVNVLATGV